MPDTTDKAVRPGKPDGTPRALGIKAKLFLAFCAMAALTLAASVVAWLIFGDIGRSVTRITVKSMPGMESALTLSREASHLSAAAPALVASRSQAERVAAHALLHEQVAVLEDLAQQLEAAGVDSVKATRLYQTVAAIEAELDDLNEAVDRRLNFKEAGEKGAAELAEIHSAFLFAIEPLVDDAVFDLVISGESVTAESTRAITALVETGVRRIERLLTAEAHANLAAGILAEVAHVRDPNAVEHLRQRFQSAAASTEESLSQLQGVAGMDAVRKAVQVFLALGTAQPNLFDLRARALEVEERDRAAIEVLQNEMSGRVREAHEAFLDLLEPVVDEATAELVVITGRLTENNEIAITELIDGGVNLLHVLLAARAEGNLAAGFLNQAVSLREDILIEPLTERFIAAAARLEREVADIPPSVEADALTESALALLDMGRADDGLFALRRQELGEIERAEQALSDSRALASDLREEVAALVEGARLESETAARSSDEAIRGGKIFMLLLTAASILGTAAVMLFFVVPRVIRPLESITGAMTDLAEGDTGVDIPGRDRDDEIGRMAKALGVFRDTAIEMQESNLREIYETRRRLSDAIESISEAFSLYDSDDRLVICNSMYRTLLYPDMADDIVPGMTFEAIVRRAAERGYIMDAQDDPDAWITGRMARHRNPSGTHIHQRSDGRWILVSERKTEDGGTVGVYSDITEMKQREQELAEKSNALERLSGQLAKYLSPQVYESIFTGRQEVKVASRRKKLTVFFSDIANFTETADRMESEDLSQLLNHYLTEMSRIALDHGATIDKYVGDAIVIFFGDPESRGVKEDALACVRMAVAMRQRMVELRKVWLDSGIETPLHCRMGINTGFCTVGNFGSEDRMDYTIIGGSVNLAARLETAAEPGEILLSYETHALVKDEFLCRERDKVTVKGIAYPVATFQVVEAHDRVDAAQRLIREESPHMSLRIETHSMSEYERSEAARILEQALVRVRGEE